MNHESLVREFARRCGLSESYARKYLANLRDVITDVVFAEGEHTFKGADVAWAKFGTFTTVAVKGGVKKVAGRDVTVRNGRRLHFRAAKASKRSE